ncbi:unnamed protein product [Leuciscus chuanchicus]
MISTFNPREDWEKESHSLTTMPLEERYTAANIAEWLEDVIAKFNIPPEKIKAVIHDNGANVAVKILAEKHGWASVRCAGNGASNTAQDNPVTHAKGGASFLDNTLGTSSDSCASVEEDDADAQVVQMYFILENILSKKKKNPLLCWGKKGSTLSNTGKSDSSINTAPEGPPLIWIQALSFAAMTNFSIGRD